MPAPSTRKTGVRSLSPLGSQYNSFLWAPVHEDRDGGSLSVLSALARLDLDAWNEASDLALLPVDHAVERLSSFLASLPSSPAVRIDFRPVAARLVKLLPPASVSPPLAPPFSRTTTALTAGLIAMLISSAILFSLDLITGTGHVSPPESPLQASPHSTPGQARPSTQPK